MIDGKILALWLPAMVVSATDGSYEVIYEGNLPRDNPFSCVHVPLDHVRPIKPSVPAVAGGGGDRPIDPKPAVAAEHAKTEDIRKPFAGDAARAEAEVGNCRKPNRKSRDHATEKKPAPRPTTAGKSIKVIREIMSEKDRRVLDTTFVELGFHVND